MYYGRVFSLFKYQVISDHQENLLITQCVWSRPGAAIKVYRPWYQAPIMSTVFPWGFKNFCLFPSISLKCFWFVRQGPWLESAVLAKKWDGLRTSQAQKSNSMWLQGAHTLVASFVSKIVHLYIPLCVYTVL